MRVLERGTPLALPAKCVQCGYGNTERVYLDLELDVEFYGSIYVCENCFNSWIDGWVTPTSYQRDQELAAARLRIEELTNERDSLLGVIRDFRIPVPPDPNQFSLPDGEATEEPKRPRRYPDDFDKSSSEPRPNDVLGFAG